MYLLPLKSVSPSLTIEVTVSPLLLRLNIVIAWIEGTAIFIAVFVVAFVGSWNDYQKEIQFLKLQAISDKDNIVSYY